MKLVMTLLVRNEADILDAQLAFHLHAGVDFVIAMDNASSDETREILERYERAGYLHLLDEYGGDMRQRQWVTRLARLAATEFEADWVINSDADEFWWPRGRTLKDVLELVPDRFGVVRGVWRHFRPRMDGDAFFAERMDVRVSTPSPPGDKSTIYHAHQKVAHRAHPEVEIEAGNHNAAGPGLEPLRTWHPLEVLHFSLRSTRQIELKSRGGWSRSRGDGMVEHKQELVNAVQAGAADAYFAGAVVSDEELAAGLANGTFAVDTRLRDVLRALRTDGGFRLPAADDSLAFPTPSVEDDAAYAGEVSILATIDGIPRADERVAALEARLAHLHRLPRR